MKRNIKELEQQANSMVRSQYDENINLLKDNNQHKVKISNNKLNIKEEIKACVTVLGILSLVALSFFYVLFNGYPF